MVIFDSGEVPAKLLVVSSSPATSWWLGHEVNRVTRGSGKSDSQHVGSVRTV